MVLSLCLQKVSAHELWHKLLMCYMVEVVKTNSVGQCTISVWHPTEEEKLTQMNLHYSNEVSVVGRCWNFVSWSYNLVKFTVTPCT